MTNIVRENQRLRELAATCYAGLGAECNLPEQWLDALHAAAEGLPFTTDGLLPFKLEPTKLTVHIPALERLADIAEKLVAKAEAESAT